MNYEPVKGSSNIAAIGYDDATKTMEVKFHNGGHYAYADVTPEKYSAFQNVARADGESTGKYFHAHFRSSHACQNLAPKKEKDE